MSSIIQIKREHDRLYGIYLRDRAGIVADPQPFVESAQKLTDRMEAISSEVTCREDYEWLRDAAEKWRSVFASALNVPRDVRLGEPRADLAPSVPKPTMIWTDPDLDQWVQQKAFALARDRALRKKEALAPADLLRRFPSTGSEKDEDWRTANLLLVCEILEGGMALAQLRPRSYARLEGCWLEDVKRLKAYFRWIDRGGGWDPALREADYLDVCEELQVRAYAAESKRPESEFHAVREYIESRYLDSGGTVGAEARGLIAAKARRLAESGSASDFDNWMAAEEYVKAFYGGILPAVCGNDTAAILEISHRVNAADHRCQLIVNAFEAVVVISFVQIGLALQAQAA